MRKLQDLELRAIRGQKRRERWFRKEEIAREELTIEEQFVLNFNEYQLILQQLNQDIQGIHNEPQINSN